MLEMLKLQGHLGVAKAPRQNDKKNKKWHFPGAKPFLIEKMFKSSEMLKMLKLEKQSFTFPGRF